MAADLDARRTVSRTLLAWWTIELASHRTRSWIDSSVCRAGCPSSMTVMAASWRSSLTRGASNGAIWRSAGGHILHSSSYNEMRMSHGHDDTTAQLLSPVRVADWSPRRCRRSPRRAGCGSSAASPSARARSVSSAGDVEMEPSAVSQQLQGVAPPRPRRRGARRSSGDLRPARRARPRPARPRPSRIPSTCASGIIDRPVADSVRGMSTARARCCWRPRPASGLRARGPARSLDAAGGHQPHPARYPASAGWRAWLGRRGGRSRACCRCCSARR